MQVVVNRSVSGALLGLFVAFSAFSPYTSAQSLVTGTVLASDTDFAEAPSCDLRVTRMPQNLVDSRSNNTAGRELSDSKLLPIRLLLASGRAKQLFVPADARSEFKWKYSCVFPWGVTFKQKQNYCACAANFPKHCDRREYAFSGEGHLIIACACKGLLSKCQP